MTCTPERDELACLHHLEVEFADERRASGLQRLVATVSAKDVAITSLVYQRSDGPAGRPRAVLTFESSHHRALHLARVVARAIQVTAVAGPHDLVDPAPSGAPKATTSHPASPEMEGESTSHPGNDPTSGCAFSRKPVATTPDQRDEA